MGGLPVIPRLSDWREVFPRSGDAERSSHPDEWVTFRMRPRNSLEIRADVAASALEEMGARHMPLRKHRLSSLTFRLALLSLAAVCLAVLRPSGRARAQDLRPLRSKRRSGLAARP